MLLGSKKKSQIGIFQMIIMKRHHVNNFNKYLRLYYRKTYNFTYMQTEKKKRAENE